MDLSLTDCTGNHTTTCQICKNTNIMITKDGATSGYCSKCNHLVFHKRCKYNGYIGQMNRTCCICKRVNPETRFYSELLNKHI